MKLNVQLLEKELRARRKYPYRWGRKQADSWDRQTQFIYDTQTFSDFQRHVQGMSEALKQYAMNRWYNFWSAMAVEQMFAEHPTVKANVNQYDKLVDFSIGGIPFDHKTSVFPKRFPYSFHYAQNHRSKLISWLYTHQSQQGRKHLRNRLFVVLYDSQAKEHWRLKAELGWLKHHIDLYMHHFDPAALFHLQVEGKSVQSDVLLLRK